jgi:DNA-binding transcriptional ArsR family regulator
MSHRKIMTEFLRDRKRSELTADIHFDNLGNMKTMDAIEVLAALAQESRLTLFRLLVKRGPEGFTPTQLSEKLGVPGATLSFHLKELQRAGLIDVRREGRFLYYSPDFEHMNSLLGFLTENCCSLGNKACAPACTPAVPENPPAKRKRA